MFFLPLCKYFFFYGIKPIRRISRQSRENAFQFKLLFFSFYIFDRKERLDSGQKYLFAPLKNKTKQQRKTGCSSGCWAFSVFRHSRRIPLRFVSGCQSLHLFSPLIHTILFFSFVFFFFPSYSFNCGLLLLPCVWFGPHTSNPFPLYYVYYFSILVRLCLCSLAVCALSVCCCCFIIFDFFFPPFFLVFLVVRFFNQKILGISCLRGMKTNEKGMKVRWSRGHKNTMIHGNKTVLAHVQRHHLAVSS